MKEFKILFSSFNQTYASLLAKDCFTKLLYLLGLLFQTMIESGSQLLFYQIIFSYFKELFPKS
jgi:hypothetical protein